jgi:dTMP kinase
MRLIIVDGLDGVGKDTHALLIKKNYEDMGEKVVLRSHPTSDNFFGRKSKQALFGAGKINKIKASVFYMFDVLRSVKKYYRRKDVDTLIMVRYLVGTAYLPSKIAGFGYKFFFNFVPTSRYMFFLDAPPDELLKRVQSRSELEMFETMKDFKKVRKIALGLVGDWDVIDTTGSVDETYSLIEEKLDLLDGKK